VPSDLEDDGKVELFGLTATGAPGDGYSIDRSDNIDTRYIRDIGRSLVRTEAGMVVFAPQASRPASAASSHAENAGVAS
jgi:hypothetical protein